MLAVGWLVAAVVVAILLSMWITFTLTRLDRLHARVDAARAALDAQLVRRAAAVMQVAETVRIPDADRVRWQASAQAALVPGRPHDREAVENAVSRTVTELAAAPYAVSGVAVEELHEAAVRVQVARRFYNDAVRDTRTLRARRMPRLLRLAGRVDLPQFFDIDDAPPSIPANLATSSRLAAPPPTPSAPRPTAPNAVRDSS